MNEDPSVQINCGVRTTLRNNVRNSRASLAYNTLAKRLGRRALSDADRDSFQSDTLLKQLSKMSELDADNDPVKSSTLLERLGTMSEMDLERDSFQSSTCVKRFGTMPDLDTGGDPAQNFFCSMDNSPRFKSNGIVVAGAASILRNRAANSGVMDEEKFMDSLDAVSMLHSHAAHAGSKDHENLFNEGHSSADKAMPCVCPRQKPKQTNSLLALGKQLTTPRTHFAKNDETEQLTPVTDIMQRRPTLERISTPAAPRRTSFNIEDKSAQGTPAENIPKGKKSISPPSSEWWTEWSQHPMRPSPSTSSTERMNFRHRRYTNNNVDVDEEVANVALKYVRVETPVAIDNDIRIDLIDDSFDPCIDIF